MKEASLQMSRQLDQNDSDWEFEDNDDIEVMFAIATQQIERSHDKLLPNDLLELYGLYKQATVGRCNTPKPGMLSMQARAKWYAWSGLEDMPIYKAKELYIEKVTQLDPKWNENIQNGINSITTRTGWVVHSVELPQNDYASKKDHEKNIFDFVKERNINRIKETIHESDFNLLDENGLGLIHWATDSNYVDILEFLLSSGCPVDFRDAGKQTALHYASSCAHLECVKLLLQFGADKMIHDADGQTCIDVADDPKIKSLLQS